jgi:uncharacterized protein
LRLASVVVLSGSIEAYWIMNPEMGILVFPLMWSPAIASVSARLVLREGFADVSFRFGGRRNLPWIALGLIVPVVVGTPAYGTAWLTGLVGFHSQPAGLVARLVGDITSPVTLFVVGIALASTIGAVFGCLLTAGEEIGWRGYMLTRLIDAGVPHPVLASGLTWALGHIPPIVASIYAAGPYPALSAVLWHIIATAVVADDLADSAASLGDRLVLAYPHPLANHSRLSARSLLGASTVSAAECGVMRHMS